MSAEQANPADYAKLNDVDETNSNTQFSFEQKDSEESNARYRTSITGSVTKDNTSSQDQAQGKQMSSAFSSIYGAVLVVSIIVGGIFLFMKILMNIDNLKNNEVNYVKFDFFFGGWCFVLEIIAFAGLWKKDLGKIKIALTMIKIAFFFFAIEILWRAQDLQESEISVSAFLVFVVAELCWLTLLLFLPTREVRNTLRRATQGEEISQKIEVNPAKKLTSLPYIIYKYVLLIVLLYQVVALIYFILKDISARKFWERMMSDWSFGTYIIDRYAVCPLFIALLFFEFEGIRRKSLEKILTSIKLMKICLVAELFLYTLKDLALHNEGKFMVSFEEYFEELEIEHSGIFWGFLLIHLAIVFFFNFGHIQIASDIRDILKADQKAKHTL